VGQLKDIRLYEARLHQVSIK